MRKKLAPVSGWANGGGLLPGMGRADRRPAPTGDEPMSVPDDVVWLVVLVAAIGAGPVFAAVLLTGRAVGRLCGAVRAGRTRSRRTPDYGRCRPVTKPDRAVVPPGTRG